MPCILKVENSIRNKDMCTLRRGRALSFYKGLRLPKIEGEAISPTLLRIVTNAYEALGNKIHLNENSHCNNMAYIYAINIIISRR
jgi:hypothetical protein